MVNYDGPLLSKKKERKQQQQQQQQKTPNLKNGYLLYFVITFSKEVQSMGQQFFFLSWPNILYLVVTVE